MLGSLTYEGSPHPLLDLSPMEQVVLLKASRSELRTAVVSLSEAQAIKHLEALELIEVQDAHWFPTSGRGNLVAYLLDRLDLARTTRRSESAPEKKAAMYVNIEQAISDLLAEIHQLAV